MQYAPTKQISLFHPYNKKNANGAISITLSILSNIPPCPGIKSLKSFISTYLFMLDAVKSPI
jgi:hypothetical protein